MKTSKSMSYLFFFFYKYYFLFASNHRFVAIACFNWFDVQWCQLLDANTIVCLSIYVAFILISFFFLLLLFFSWTDFVKNAKKKTINNWTKCQFSLNYKQKRCLALYQLQQFNNKRQHYDDFFWNNFSISR